MKLDIELGVSLARDGDHGWMTCVCRAFRVGK